MTPETKTFLKEVAATPTFHFLGLQFPKTITISEKTRKRVWADCTKPKNTAPMEPEDLDGICQFQIVIDDSFGLFEYRIE